MTYFSVSVDVEEDLPGILPYGVRGIEEGLPALLDILDDLHLRADFFFLASVAREYPDLVREVASKGHAVGNHGLDHGLLCQKPIEVQRKDIRVSTRALTDLAGVRPVMFRAPNFSVDDFTLAILEDEGYLIDSSVLPGRLLRRVFRNLYDHRRAPSRPYHPRLRTSDTRGRLLEIPVTANPLRPGAPLGQGALNVNGPTKLLEIVRSLSVGVFVFLIHPWELVDLALWYPSLPSGYSDACSRDLEPLRDFLTEAKAAFPFITLGEYPTQQDGDAF
jgi:hypothetical protein